MYTLLDLEDRKELTCEELSIVAGGTFTPNTYRADAYHAIGISTRYNFFDKDEFRFMGRPITVSEADDLVRIARNVSSVINGGYQGANKIGYNEERFIVAFNSQISPKYGVKWDGVPGSDF